jgi:hypothetical protein
MKVEAKELKAAGCTEAGAPHNGSRVPETPGIGTDLRDKILDGLKHRVSAPRKIVRVAFQAGPKTSGLGLIARGEKPHVLGLRLAGLARGQAINPRG